MLSTVIGCDWSGWSFNERDDLSLSSLENDAKRS